MCCAVLSGCVVSVQGAPSGSWSNPACPSLSGCAFSHGSVALRDCGTTTSWSDITVRTAAAVTGPGTTGKCLDIDKNATADFSKVQLYDCNGLSTQVWHLP
ncbi:hypothetical protein [Streptomyces sp. NPDC054783]